MSKRRRRSNKAQVPTARQGARSAVDRVNSMTQPAASANVGESVPMQRDPSWAVVPFAPSQPIAPSAINRPRPDTGRPEPRLYEVPVGWNLPGSSHRHLPWFMLREAADRITLFRRCIEIRKNHMQGLDWGFRISPGAVAAAERASGGTPRAKLERQLHQDLGDEIARAKAWWAVPDKGQDYEFSEWLGLMLEEVYVLDALAIYPRLTYGGQLDSLEVLDGTTIKPLRDERGGRPRPPLPAFQQILWGFPRGEFQATVDDQGLVPGALAADDLVYKRRVIRTHTPYGYSPVEQALDDGDLYLKRHQWMKAEYTVGAMPAGTFEVAPDAGLSPQQVADLERFYNDLLSGNTEERMKARFLPPGITPSERGDIAEKYKPEYDIHLLQLAISHFDTVLTELGFTESGGGLGSAGYHEGQEDVQQRKTLPILKDIQGLVSRLSHRYLGTPAEVEFYFLGLDDEDEAAADALEEARFKSGVLTLNDRRDRLGQERYTFAEADKPMIVLTRGILFLEGSSEGVPGGAAIEPGKALQEGGASQSIQQQVEADEGDPEEQDDSTEPPAKPAPGQSAKDAEAKAYRKWATKGRSRAFEWHHHTAAEISALTKAGGGDPKGVAREWPGWAKDQKLAAHYSPLLSRAMTGAVQTRALADAWLTARKAVDASDAGVWLGGQGVDFTVVLDDLMSMIYTEGYAVGDVSAASLASAEPVDWGAWTPGDVAAAQQLVDEAGATGGLQNLLNSAGVTIRSINANRLDDLAQVLANGLEQGLAPAALDKEIAALLEDPQWASMVAQTETTRAVSAATLDRYRDLNVDASAWATAEDERVCPICGGNEDQGPVGLGQVFESGDAGPPAHPLCLPGDALVLTGSRVTGATKRMYDGELVEISTLGQKQFTATPNHPVLTSRGWVRVGELGEGDDVVAHLGSQWSIVVGVDDQDVPARIEDVAEAFLCSGNVTAAEVPVAAEDFHGDGAGSEVAVVGSDRGLLPVGNSASVEVGREQGFKAGHVAGIGLSSTGGRFKSGAGAGASRGLMRSLGNSGPFLGSRVGHACEHGSAPVTRHDAVIDQYAADGPTGDGIALRERLFRLPGEVTADEVVSVRRYPFSGHVFNLETVDGWYIGNGIVSHNCRCALMPVVASLADLTQ